MIKKLKKNIHKYLMKSDIIRLKYLPEKYYAMSFYEQFIESEIYCDSGLLQGEYAHRLNFHKLCPNAAKSIISMFKRTGVRAERISPEFWKSILLLPLLKTNEFQEENDNAVAIISSTPSGILSVREWVLIYKFVNLLYLYDISCVLRFHASSRAISDIENRFLSGKKLVVGCSALIETGDLERASRLLLEHNNKISDDLIRLFDKYIGLLSGNGINGSANVRVDGVDKDYFNYIKDKSVAIVGPLKESEDIKKEISEFDIKVGFNVRSNINNNVMAAKYSGYDVCYYNKATFGYICDDNTLLVPDFVKFANLRGKVNNRPRTLYSSSSSETKFRSFTDYKKIMLNGSFTGVPNAVQDLLACKPKKIKIFSSNLHSSWNNYLNDHHLKTLKLNLRLASNHDLITNFVFMRNAWKDGLFLADDELAGVLDLEVNQYMHNIQMTSLLEY